MGKRRIANSNRAFKGVWIDKKYWLDENLQAMEMLFLVEIDSLDNEDGCFASNKHFANFFGVTAGRASQIINALKNKGYITISYERKGKQIIRRKIKVVNKLNTPLVKKLNKGIKKTKGGYLENCKDSNTYKSNTYKSNTDNGQARPDKSAAVRKQIIVYLNSKLHTSYKPNAAKNKKLINARLNEGYSFDDFKKVIDTKFDDWSNDSRMAKYLRPETLFGTKMEGYVNEKQPTNPNDYHSVGYYEDWNHVGNNQPQSSQPSADSVPTDDLPF